MLLLSKCNFQMYYKQAIYFHCIGAAAEILKTDIKKTSPSLLCMEFLIFFFCVFKLSDSSLNQLCCSCQLRWSCVFSSFSNFVFSSLSSKLLIFVSFYLLNLTVFRLLQIRSVFFFLKSQCSESNCELLLCL